MTVPSLHWEQLTAGPELFQLPLSRESTRLYGLLPSRVAIGDVPSLMIDWERAPGLLSRREPPAEQSLQGSRLPLALIIHCYHPKALSMVLRCLPDDQPVDLLLSTDTGGKAARLERFISEQGTAHVRLAHLAVLPNHGRDVLPFWHCLQHGGQSTTARYFIKLHLKQSPYLGKEVDPAVFDADQWVAHLLACLLPATAEEVAGLMARMDEERIALVLPTPPPFLRAYGWGRLTNLEQAAAIAAQLSVDPMLLALPLMFPVGNMFIGKVSLFAEFASLLADAGCYPEEPLPDDGSFLHAVERIPTALCLSRGFQIAYSLHPTVDRLSTVDAERSASRQRLVMPVLNSLQPLHAAELAELLRLQAAGLAVAQQEVRYLCSHPMFLMAMRLKHRWQSGLRRFRAT
jgi:lipopolysaccharide biosynthesis protein